jgi:hypothetical protein
VGELLLPDVFAGVETLVSQGIEFDVWEGARPKLELTERDLDVLEALSELRYLTTGMLAVLAWGPYNTRLRERLRLLFHAGLVRRFRPPLSRTAGGAQWVYELDVSGHRALVEHRPASTPEWSRSELFAFSYVEHDLELNVLLCELAARAARHVGASGPLWRSAPFRIQGPRSGRVDPAVERRPADADPANELPEGHFADFAWDESGVLEPDATLLGIHAGTGKPIAIMIEYDRTRRATKLIGKLGRYDHFLADGWRYTRYGRLAFEPGVFFVTRDDDHVDNVLREADRRLRWSVGPAGGRPPRRYVGREEIGVISRSQLLEDASKILTVTEEPDRDREIFEAIGEPWRYKPTFIEHDLALASIFAARPGERR